MRLLNYIFSAATDVPEFQRQMATPNVPKFSLALIALAEKQDDREVKVCILQPCGLYLTHRLIRVRQLLSLAVLARLIPLYPTLHRPQHTALQSLCLKFLNGSVPRPTDAALLEAASRLYSVLHFTGGKVGAVNLWRKSLDETLAFTRSALLSLRTSFPSEGKFMSTSSNLYFIPDVMDFSQGHSHAPNQPGASTEDPIIWLPLNIDRLRCGVFILCDLVR